jgi:hypothetical protein
MNKAIGVLLVVVGLLGIIWGGISYTTSKKVVDLGPIQATKETRHDLPIPPIAGALALIGGVILLTRSQH